MDILDVFQTTIKLGNIEIDAYTAHEKDSRGNWANYLSGRGLAKSIGMDESTTRGSQIPKKLKQSLGNGFTMRGGRYKMVSGGVSKVKLWTTTQANKYYRYHEKQGNLLAELICDALSDAALDIIINDAFERPYVAGTAQNLVNSRIIDAPRVWERLYSDAIHITAVKWFGPNFYWDFCYCFLNAEEVCKLNLLNPIVNGERDFRIHQYLDDATRIELEKHLIRVIDLVESSTGKQDFLTRYQKLFGRVFQLDLAI